VTAGTALRTGPRVVLVGLPGAGKSTTGRRLARILCVPFADSDDLVEETHAMTVAELFADRGEAAFRVAEAAVIGRALREFDGVLALGGGALTTDITREAILEARLPVALLHASLPTLTARIGDGRTRPLLSGDPVGQLQLLAEQRRPLYAAVATFSIDTTGRTPGQVAATIAARLHELGALR
jgi:shikimate kinase